MIPQPAPREASERICVTPRTEVEFLRRADWWEREAARGYPSAADSKWYAANMRGAAERRKRDRRALPWTPGYDFPVPRDADPARPERKGR